GQRPRAPRVPARHVTGVALVRVPRQLGGRGEGGELARAVGLGADVVRRVHVLTQRGKVAEVGRARAGGGAHMAADVGVAHVGPQRVVVDVGAAAEVAGGMVGRHVGGQRRLVAMQRQLARPGAPALQAHGAEAGGGVHAPGVLEQGR
ncbi:hypothetical protein APUTEX25_004608, partial [Auxenochlorella protothecoides]